MARKSSEEKKYVVTTQELSEILGLSKRRIQQLAKEGALIRAARGQFDLPSSIQSYIEHMNKDTKEELDKTREEALWTRARRQKAELELQIMKGQLHRSEDVEKVMNDMLSSFRAQMLVIPGKVAPKVLGQTDLELIKRHIKADIYEALQELSDYDPDVFYAKSQDKISIDEDIGEENVDWAEKEPEKNDKQRPNK